MSPALTLIPGSAMCGCSSLLCLSMAVYLPVTTIYHPWASQVAPFTRATYVLFPMLMHSRFVSLLLSTCSCARRLLLHIFSFLDAFTLSNQVVLVGFRGVCVCVILSRLLFGTCAHGCCVAYPHPLSEHACLCRPVSAFTDLQTTEKSGISYAFPVGRSPLREGLLS
jgi:hypothetical protein